MSEQLIFNATISILAFIICLTSVCPNWIMPSKNFFSSAFVSEVIFTAFDNFFIDNDDFFCTFRLIIFVDLTRIFDIGYRIFWRKDNGIAIISATNKGFRFAYVLGITSPKSSIKNVVRNIWKIKFKTGLLKSM